MEENIMLILGENIIETCKEKLANKSRYFESLFSHNFVDCHNKEHIINYDIALSTLQNLVEWIHDDEERIDIHCHSFKPSMTKFIKDNFADLLSLLELSVLFMVDELINDIVDIIILFWLQPKKVIDIWLLAEELGEKVLRDVCFSVCLDRFKELPLHLLIELPEDNITQLLQNVNVRASTHYLQFVRNKWMQYNKTLDIPNIKNERQLNFVHSIIVYKEHECGNKFEYLYIWNGNVLSECTQVKTMQCPRKFHLIGMQTTGRGFSLYTVGGELGLGTGRFSTDIWRYCLISKKWYYYGKMPYPKRHMIAVFIRNQLILVGGVGKHRVKSYSTLDLNIHTGNWQMGDRIPESFSEVPPHCVMNGKLFVIMAMIYIYDPVGSCWKSVNIDSIPHAINACLTPHSTVFFLSGDHQDNTVLSRIDASKELVCKKKDCLKQYLDHNVMDVKIIFDDQWCQLRHGQIAGINVILVNKPDDKKNLYLHSHTELRTDFVNFTFSTNGRSFKIIDPDTLHNTVQS